MAQETWLPLTEYSTKYHVSISTLRRRIKTQRIQFEYRDGKYFVADQPLRKHERVNTSFVQEPTPVPAPIASPAPKPIPAPVAETPVPESDPISFEAAQTAEKLNHLELSDTGSPVLATANKILNELKAAYKLILQEKEEQILRLRDELNNHQTLTQILEEENERLRANAREAAPIDSWLEKL